MKKELSLEHLAAYLPYGLIGRESPTSLDYRLTGLSLAGPIWGPAYDLHDFPRHSLTSRTDCKLILRPLSDLTREITHNGETFEPMQRLVDEIECDAEWSFIKAIEDDWASAQGKMRFAPYSIATKLHSWHFDTFGLCDSGLAIDINTLKK
jgi:hypothetical protein